MLLVRVPDQEKEPAGKEGSAAAGKPARPTLGGPAPAEETLSVPRADGGGDGN